MPKLRTSLFFVLLLFPEQVVTSAFGSARVVHCTAALDDPGKRLVQLLEPPDGQAPDLEQGLIQLREPALETLFEIVALGGIPANRRTHGAGFEPLSSSNLRLLHSHLNRVALGSLRGFLDGLERADEREKLRMLGVDVLAEEGTARDLGLIFRLATPAGSRDGLIKLSLRRSLEQALQVLGRRDDRLPQELGKIFGSLHEALQPSVVRVLSRLKSAEALGVLGSCLGVNSALDPYVMNAIAGAARDVPHPLQESLRRLVRGRLKSENQNLMYGAMAAAGALEDYDALPQLLDSLGSSEAQERLQAWRSLVAVTGLSYGEDPKSWRRWYEREQAWWRDTLPSLTGALVRGTDKQVRAAIEHICASKMDRHRLSEELLQVLTNPNPQLVRLACVGLGRFRSRLAVPGLVRLLSGDDELVVESAHQALMAITGMKLPANPFLWAEQTRGF